MVGSAANMIVAYSSGSGKHIVRYHSVIFTIHWIFFAPLITCDRLLRVEGKTCALIHIEELPLLHPMQSVFYPCFGSTVSLIVQYVLRALSENVFRDLDQI